MLIRPKGLAVTSAFLMVVSDRATSQASSTGNSFRGRKMLMNLFTSKLSVALLNELGTSSLQNSKLISLVQILTFEHLTSPHSHLTPRERAKGIVLANTRTLFPSPRIPTSTAKGSLFFRSSTSQQSHSLSWSPLLIVYYSFRWASNPGFYSASRLPTSPLLIRRSLFWR